MLVTLILCSALLQAPAGDDLATAREKLSAGEIGPALEILSGMLDRHEGSERDVRLLLAQAQMDDGAPDRAAETLQPLLEGDDHEALLTAARAYKAWGDMLSRQGRKPADIDFAYENARNHFERAAKVAPADQQQAGQIELAYFELYTAGEADAAIERADALLAADAKDGEALLLRGCAGLQASVAAAGDGDEEAAAVKRGRAIKDLLAADEVLPKTRHEPWVQLAWLYEADGQAVKAVDAAATLLDRLGSADFGTLYHLASRYAGERKFDAAGKALGEMARRDDKQLTKLIAAEADVAATAQQFAWATGPMVNAQRFRDARNVLAPIVAAEPRNSDVWNNYGFVCRETGDNEESYRAYAKALEIDPSNPRLLNDLAVMLHYYLHRDYDKAQELYEKAVEQADEALKLPTLDATAKADLEEARKDAVNNLKKLAAGEHDWNG